METFRLIDGQRVHFRDGARVHGFITNGGQAVNIIPETAAAEISVRAMDGAELARVREIVERCARGASLACGVEVAINVRQGYRDLVPTCPSRAALVITCVRSGAPPPRTDSTVGAGSTDMGDVSHAVPSIHPWIAICNLGETTCTSTRSPRARAASAAAAAMIVAAKSMALTTTDLIEDAALRAEVRRAFDERRAP